MLITPPSLNTRHAGPKRVAVGSGTLQQLICDTTKVNTGTAETTDTDRDIQQLADRLAALEDHAGDAPAPRPLRDRAAAQAAVISAIIDRHDQDRPKSPRPGGMMARQPRDRKADRSAIQAAASRLLAGTPLRSASGKLTVTELITESGLRRDIA